VKAPREHEAALAEAGFDVHKLGPACAALLADYAVLAVEVESLRGAVELAGGYLDCGDSSCLFASAKGGMRTNGGCRCKGRPFAMPALAKLYHAARAAVRKVTP
jgi:hypothetical protein